MAQLRLSTQDYLDSNASGRAFAIILIVLCHIPATHRFWEPLSPFISGGKLAVSLFCFYSGLLLQYQLYHKKGNFEIKPWLLKRFLRLYPSYWIGLAVTLIVSCLLKKKVYTLTTIFLNFLGIPLLFGQPVISAGYGGPYWFISLIILCYILFIFVKDTEYKGVLFFLSMLLSLSAIYFKSGLNYLAVLAFPSFFLGLFYAKFLDKRQSPSLAVSFITTAMLFVVLIFCYRYSYFMKIPDEYNLYIEMLGCVCLSVIALFLSYCIGYFCVFFRKFSKRLFKCLTWLGTVSFGVYCIHEPLLIILEKLTAADFAWFGLIIYFSAVIIASYFLSNLEKRIKIIFRQKPS
ncbi:MAG: acyltransferase family protein [Planctomycetota bacterium]